MTSARTGSNVEAAFLDLVERAMGFADQQEKALAAAATGASQAGARGGAGGASVSVGAGLFFFLVGGALGC